MKVILKQHVENLGDIGEVVQVKNGYGRNYLIPQGMAALATAGNVRAVAEEKKQASLKLSKIKEEAEVLADKLMNIELALPVRVGEENRIFGTITNADIAAALAKKGLEIDRRKITVNEEIRVLGVYSAAIKLHPEVEAQVKLRVENEADETE